MKFREQMVCLLFCFSLFFAFGCKEFGTPVEPSGVLKGYELVLGAGSHGSNRLEINFYQGCNVTVYTDLDHVDLKLGENYSVKYNSHSLRLYGLYILNREVIYETPGENNGTEVE